MYLAVLDGSEKPDLISPASSLQIHLLHDLSSSGDGSPVVDDSDHERCRSMLTTPLVLVSWVERGNVLWDDEPGEDLWLQLHDALINPAGWEAYDHPEWGYIKFGHTDPTRSNSGFMTIVLMTYGYFNKTENLSAEEILSNQEFQNWLEEFESSVSDFGSSTGTYMKDIVAYGPSKFDIVAVYEATAIEHVENAQGRYGELRIFYPPATIMSDHPFCILDAEWVSEEKAEAALLFMEYLESTEAQEIALLEYGFRPVDQSIELDMADSPFLQYQQNGLQIELPVEVQTPSGSVLDTLLTFWVRNIQR
jgi:ABC-type Fe3+ transport system substrate-binding protein